MCTQRRVRARRRRDLSDGGPRAARERLLDGIAARQRTQQLVKLDPAIDLDGLINSIAFESGRPRFELSGNNWGARQKDLPEQLRPFLTGRIEADAAPVSGVWRGGDVVHRRAARAARGCSTRRAGTVPRRHSWGMGERELATGFVNGKVLESLRLQSRQKLFV